LIWAAVLGATTSNGSELKVISWLSEESDFWNKVAIPSFNKSYPDIHVEFTGTTPGEYSALLAADLAGGNAADLIFCRPFENSSKLYRLNHLISLNSAALAKYSDVAKAAWSTDDGKVTYCLPVVSVIHGFIYNKDALRSAGATEPTTLEDFHKVLEQLKKGGKYTPLVLGTADEWEAATVGFENVGPNFWRGEIGRRNLMGGKAKLTDPPYVAAFRELANWAPYLGDKFQTQSYTDSQNLFLRGGGAIYAAGSWEIPLFRAQATFPMGAFKPPILDGSDECYISDQSDFGIGINAASPNKADATRFLEWISTPEFGELYANTFPGAFPLSADPIKIQDPLAATFLSWRQACKSTIRLTSQILSPKSPIVENLFWEVSSQVIEYTLSPESAALQAQHAMERSFAPAR
jgi:raffinose/stachyose/melibiose transport system substrate-binding protein